MASIEKKMTKAGKPTYRVRWWAGDRRCERWLPTLAEARALKTLMEADALAGVAVDPRSGSRVLNDYFGSWIDTRLVRGRPLTPATRLGYQRLWRRNIEPTIGQRQLRAITPEHVRSWHGALTSKAGADQAAKSYRLLRAVLNTAENDEIIRANPCRIRGGGQESHDERPMVPTSLVLELADAIGPRYRALVLVAGFAGLRTGESLGLRRKDVDLLHGELHVAVQAQELTGRGRTVLRPKSDAGKRVVAIPGVVTAALDDHLATVTPSDPESPVFIGPEGGPLRRATLSRAWSAAVATCGAPAGLRPHDLRHHAATLTARMPGVTTKELMARIGHSSPRAALIYQHATAERDRAIATFLDEQVAGAEQAKTAPVLEVDPSAWGAGGGLESPASGS